MQTFANSLALFNKTMVFTFQVGSEVCGGHGKWKCQTEDEDSIDKDTLPDRKNIREKLNLVEAECLSFVVDEVRAGADSVRMITAAIDSTVVFHL